MINLINSNEEIIEEYLDLSISQNKKILERNEKEWYEFISEFTWDEVFQMRKYMYAHPVNIEYDLNSDDDVVSDLVHDYIGWLVYDLIFNSQYADAKAVLNNGYVS